MQFAVRIAGTLAEQDVALSYYNGRTDFPQPFSNHTKQVDGDAAATPTRPTSCIDGVLSTDVLLGYPRMHVYGLNASGEFNPFKGISESIHGIGYRRRGRATSSPSAPPSSSRRTRSPPLLQPAGEYDYQGNGQPRRPARPPSSRARPSSSGRSGLDYTFGAHVYVNAQWVHGLVDEFGAGDCHAPGLERCDQSGVNTMARADRLPCALRHAPTTATQCATETLPPASATTWSSAPTSSSSTTRRSSALFTIWALSGVTIETSSTRAESKRVGHALLALHRARASPPSIFPELDYNFGNGLELGAGALVLLGHATPSSATRRRAAPSSSRAGASASSRSPDRKTAGAQGTQGRGDPLLSLALLAPLRSLVRVSAAGVVPTVPSAVS